MNVVAQLLAALAVAVLKAVWARADLKDEVRLELAAATLELAQKALEWKLSVGGGGADFRVRPDAKTVHVPGHNSDVPVSPRHVDG